MIFSLINNMKTIFTLLLLIVCSAAMAQNRKYSKLIRAKPTGDFKPPEYPGGEQQWIKFIERNFNGAKIEDGLANNISEFKDTLLLKFVITKDSLLVTPEATTSTSPHFKQAIFAVLKRSPKWIPATRNGIAINAAKFYRLCYSMSADVSGIQVIPITVQEFKQ